MNEKSNFNDNVEEIIPQSQNIIRPIGRIQKPKSEEAIKNENECKKKRLERRRKKNKMAKKARKRNR